MTAGITNSGNITTTTGSNNNNSNNNYTKFSQKSSPLFDTIQSISPGERKRLNDIKVTMKLATDAKSNTGKDVSEHPKKSNRKWSLLIVVVCWYTFSSISNNVSKSIFHIFHYPVSLALWQFLFIVIGASSILFVFKLHAFHHKPLREALTRVSPLAVGHIVAHLLTLISLGNVPVSFTHTIKATSPIFAVILTRVVLGEKHPIVLVLTLLPIILGVSLSTMHEINFNMLGFVTAICSTFVFSCQNVYSKKLFRDYRIDHILLLLYASLLAFIGLLPIWFYWEGYGFLTNGIEIEDKTLLIQLLLTNGFSHFMQNIMAFTALTLISPISYTIFNTLKRIFVIVTSVLYFGNTITLINGLGILMAISGMGLYNKVKLDIKNAKLEKLRNITNV